MKSFIKKPGHRIIQAEVSQKARGRARIQIIERGRVVKDFGWQNNLILNQGLNNICSTYKWGLASLYCAAGSGTTATSNASGGGVTATGTTGTFTNDTPGSFDFTTNSSVGDMIQMTSGVDIGVEVRITTVTDANNVVYTPANSIASGEFTVWRTSQTGLTTELKRTNNYLTGTGNCGSTMTGSVVTYRRTYDFTAEVGSVTYNEVGFSNSATPTTNLFSRIKLASGVALTSGQALRVIYDIEVTISPTTSVPQTFSITGWPVAPAVTTDGDEQIIRPGLSGIAADGLVEFTIAGSTSAFYGGDCLEPSVTTGAFIWISQSSAAIDVFNSTGSAPTSRSSSNVGNKAVSLSSYVAFDFFRDKTVTFTVVEANSTLYRTMGLGSSVGSSTAYIQGVAFVCLFDEAQTKDSLHTLTLNFRITVGRVLA